jgi:hypothetical protein
MNDEDYLWEPSLAAPDVLTQHLEARLRPLRTSPPPLAPVLARARTLRLQRAFTRTGVSLGTLAAAASMLWAVTRPSAWKAVALGGQVRVETQTVSGGVALHTTVVETRSEGRASLNIGKVGVAQLYPNSRITADRSAASEHRMRLSYGSLVARIGAPPRRVVIQTASTEVIDLGCVFALSADSLGNGVLAVQEGSVELHRQGVRVAVPAGYAASFYATHAPGLPVPIGASKRLRSIVRSLDVDGITADRVRELLAASDSSAAITLWYLLPRLVPESRSAVITRLMQYAPLPASVSQEQVLANNTDAIQRWQRVLERRWQSESLSWGRRELLIRGIPSTPIAPLPFAVESP